MRRKCKIRSPCCATHIFPMKASADQDHGHRLARHHVQRSRRIWISAKPQPAEKVASCKEFYKRKVEKKDNPLYNEMLRKEFEIGCSLNHPNIREYYSMREFTGLGMCVEMEWIDARTLISYSRVMQEHHCMPHLSRKYGPVRLFIDDAGYFLKIPKLLKYN